MTLRDRYLAALRNEAAPDLIWAPDFDYWLNVNRAEGTLPPRYLGMGASAIRCTASDERVWCTAFRRPPAVPAG